MNRKEFIQAIVALSAIPWKSLGAIKELAVPRPKLPIGQEVFVSLHRGAVGDKQTDNEANFYNYARVCVPVAGWKALLNEEGEPYKLLNASTIKFNECTRHIMPNAFPASCHITHFAVGTQAFGSGVVLASGPIRFSHEVYPGTTVAFNSEAMEIDLDA